ncbi:hypothetical protein BOX15_Mlig010263g3 [Macrostomum lignano]|uniref:Uncharacterized protein n=2 Tax=Macrostomum lignano TaxID=282301 RepID=A0A267G808_9PLAT|nr:hypothetical protein BOX15_Mlig010263g3 [Macrostomum lignano]
MSVYERLSSDKKSPPESRKHRRQLQFGRYDYHVEDESSSQDQQQQQQQQQKRSAADVDAIVQRLRQDVRRNDNQQQPKHSHRTVSEAEAREIFNRLQQCDFSRWPVESRVGRHELGQNRYDFYRGSNGGSQGKPGVTKAELETIISRLSAYDVDKTPPNSRALEIKQSKAAP